MKKPIYLIYIFFFSQYFPKSKHKNNFFNKSLSKSSQHHSQTRLLSYQPKKFFFLFSLQNIEMSTKEDGPPNSQSSSSSSLSFYFYFFVFLCDMDGRGIEQNGIYLAIFKKLDPICSGSEGWTIIFVCFPSNCPNFNSEAANLML